MENPGNMPPETSVKRKRGRPRKDEGGRSGHRIMPRPVLNNNNGKQSGILNPIEKTVAGVVDAAFNGGYLVTVKIGNTETILKGVVFKPGQHVPLLSPEMISIGRNLLKQQVATPTKSSETISSK
ncbi:uncharacterized protein LOC124939745, partial [Impatiens glandulifera]|uniref:uncharacterized protein LOC124939745 n=1 Tax=Impatiens glandulifera TaxID=253017 RepID=UPI001FB0BDBC